VGYQDDPASILETTFGDTENYHNTVLLKDINITGLCEHHMLPICGRAHVAYLPTDRVVGISKIARIADVFSKRLISQEKMTCQIASALNESLRPRGVAVAVEALHSCMTIRGVSKESVSCRTFAFHGVFETDRNEQQRFLEMLRN
jgi:GTP cyclohydrolase I